MTTTLSPVEQEIQIANTAMVATSRALSTATFESAADLKAALRAWAQAKIDVLDAYRAREFARSESVEYAHREAEKMQRQQTGFYDLIERLDNISTK